MAMAGFPISAHYRTVDELTKVKPRRSFNSKAGDVDAILKAKLKRTRKAAKRLRNSCIF